MEHPESISKFSKDYERRQSLLSLSVLTFRQKTERIAPFLGDLKWDKATVPTPHGFISVEFRADDTVLIDSAVLVLFSLT